MPRPHATLLAAALAMAGAASAAGPPPGEYIAEGGWGRLSISAPTREGLPFAIDAVGGNFHVCNVEGTIVGGRAVFPSDGDDEADCVIAFATTGEGVDVSADAPSCRQFCGMRAGFVGLYLRPAAGCGDDARSAMRDAFKRQYDRKRYAEALATLSPLLERCRRTLDRYEEGRVRNDIAIAQYRLGRPDDCVRTLDPYAEEAALPDESILDDYPPSDGEAWLPIVRAARFNLGLCRKRR